MDRMDDIVWSINPGNDSLENLFLRIKTFAAKLFEAKEINYEINISDEIRHFDTNKISYGNGLNNMKKRAKEIKGHIQIVSKINDGTKITLLAKIK